MQWGGSWGPVVPTLCDDSAIIAGLCLWNRARRPGGKDSQKCNEHLLPALHPSSHTTPPPYWKSLPEFVKHKDPGLSYHTHSCILQKNWAYIYCKPTHYQLGEMIYLVFIYFTVSFSAEEMGLQWREAPQDPPGRCGEALLATFSQRRNPWKRHISCFQSLLEKKCS